jgi:hypothetical protein
MKTNCTRSSVAEPLDCYNSRAMAATVTVNGRDYRVPNARPWCSRLTAAIRGTWTMPWRAD